MIAHESRFLDEDKDLLVLDGIPVTRACRTLCDLAGLVELGELSRFTLDHALLEAVRRDLVDVASVWRECERLGGDTRLGGAVIMDALQRFVPPKRATETMPESLVLQLLRETASPTRFRSTGSRSRTERASDSTSPGRRTGRRWSGIRTSITAIETATRRCSGGPA